MIRNPIVHRIFSIHIGLWMLLLPIIPFPRFPFLRFLYPRLSLPFLPHLLFLISPFTRAIPFPDPSPPTVTPYFSSYHPGPPVPRDSGLQAPGTLTGPSPAFTARSQARRLSVKCQSKASFLVFHLLFTSSILTTGLTSHPSSLKVRRWWDSLHTRSCASIIELSFSSC